MHAKISLSNELLTVVDNTELDHPSGNQLETKSVNWSYCSDGRDVILVMYVVFLSLINYIKVAKFSTLPFAHNVTKIPVSLCLLIQQVNLYLSCLH